MLTQADPIHESAAYRVARLEEERDRLQRRICWALRRKDAVKAERLGNQLTKIERELAEPMEASGRGDELRRRYGPDIASALGW